MHRIVFRFHFCQDFNTFTSALSLFLRPCPRDEAEGQGSSSYIRSFFLQSSSMNNYKMYQSMLMGLLAGALGTAAGTPALTPRASSTITPITVSGNGIQESNDLSQLMLTLASILSRIYQILYPRR